jgi:hypothetical protein
MEVVMKILNSEQNARFAEVNARCGLGPDEFTAKLADSELAALPKTRVMASTGHSDFPPYILPIGSVEDMRKLVGLAGAFVPPKVGSEPDYPPPPTIEEVESFLNATQGGVKPLISHGFKERIEKAAIAYVVGDPEKVKGYEPMINSLLYPGRVAVFSGETLDVPSGSDHVLTGDDPVMLNYGKITVAKGGTIKVKSRAFISAQLFSEEPGGVTADQSYTIQNIGDPWSGPASQGGTGPTGPVQTSTGTNGASSYNNGNCQWECSTQPGNGPAGHDGGQGYTGTPGAQGHPSAGGIYRLGQVTNPITMLIGGGDGQQGGQGGPGGAGGQGGTKGNAATGCTNSPSDGVQGRGGQGGNGGPGGPGGDSGYVTVYYSYDGQGPGISVTVRTVAGGAGGLPGPPGSGIGNNGSGNTGTPPGTQGAVPKYALNKS